MSVARVTEISSTSPQSFEDAVKQGIDRATKTLRGVTAAWLQDQRERFDELHQQLLAEGWRPAGHGAHWWSTSYKRPDLDWDTPADTQPSPTT